MPNIQHEVAESVPEFLNSQEPEFLNAEGLSNPEELLQRELQRFDRAYRNHQDAKVFNHERLRGVPHPHTAAMCRVLSSILEAFHQEKVYFIVEAEILALGSRARPEDLVGWIEGIGVVVIEVKSHRINGIRSIQNNVPQVIYTNGTHADVDLLDQPRDFAFNLKGRLEMNFDDNNLNPPPLFFAGWMPYVSPDDVAMKGWSVADERVWLSDMLEASEFRARIALMKNITAGNEVGREGLVIFSKLFGITDGLRHGPTERPPVTPQTLGHRIDQRERELKQLTKEQHDLAFSPKLVVGPKVIRGVAGSGKTVVLANAVAEQLLEELARQANPELFNSNDGIGRRNILVLCYNRVLVSYLDAMIRECFNARRGTNSITFPSGRVKISNIHRLAWGLCMQTRTSFNKEDISRMVKGLLDSDSIEPKYDFVFIDEGQDLDHDWYPLIRQLTKPSDAGLPIFVFYDDAQNLRGVRRPGSAGQVTWTELLGTEPHSRGLRTIMRVGHRNTNQILSFSFNLLLGAFAERDPQMAIFAGLNEYTDSEIPDDPRINHPNAGESCVEELDGRRYKVNFAIHDGPVPSVETGHSQQLASRLVKEIQRLLSPGDGNVQPSDILVLAPTQVLVTSLAGVFDQAGIPFRTLLRENGMGPDPRDELLIQRHTVTISTIHAAKGYTAHIVHVMGVDRLIPSYNNYNYSREREQRARAQLHVACTRATVKLYLWGTQCPLMEEAKEAVEALA